MNFTRFYSVNVTGIKIPAGGQHQTVANTNIASNPSPPLLPGH